MRVACRSTRMYWVHSREADSPSRLEEVADLEGKHLAVNAEVGSMATARYVSLKPADMEFASISIECFLILYRICE